jgi:hypothetical protein
MDDHDDDDTDRASGMASALTFLNCVVRAARFEPVSFHVHVNNSWGDQN